MIIRKTLKPGDKDAEADLAALDAMTDEDIARQIAEDPDVAPDMSEWTASTPRLIQPLEPAE